MAQRFHTTPCVGYIRKTTILSSSTPLISNFWCRFIIDQFGALGAIGSSVVLQIICLFLLCKTMCGKVSFDSFITTNYISFVFCQSTVNSPARGPVLPGNLKFWRTLTTIYQSISIITFNIYIYIYIRW